MMTMLHHRVVRVLLVRVVRSCCNEERIRLRWTAGGLRDRGGGPSSHRGRKIGGKLGGEDCSRRWGNIIFRLDCC